MFKWSFLLLIILQLNITLSSTLVQKTIAPLTGLAPEKGVQLISKVSSVTASFSQKFFGITRHPVFMDGHFENIRSIKVVYQGAEGEITLPMTGEDGLPGPLLRSGLWVNWTFRVTPTKSKDEIALQNGLERFTAYWLGREGLDGKSLREFQVYERKDKVVWEWEEGLLHDNMAREWDHLGQFSWKDGNCALNLNE